jgi:hypothetical protein
MITVRVNGPKSSIGTAATSDQLREAGRMALNDTLDDARLFMWRHVNKHVAIKKPPNSPRTPKTIVESRLKLNWANRGDTQAVIELKATELPLRWFDPKEKRVPRAARSESDRGGGNAKRGRMSRRTQTTVKIEKGGNREVVPNAFGPSIEKLGRTVWRRAGKQRKPLEKPVGVELPAILRRRGGVQEITQQTQDRLEKNVIRRIKRIKYWYGRKRNQSGPT